MAKGRKANHFRTAGGDTIVGLIKQKDGRYRILATGVRFVATSEAEALAKFYALQPATPATEIPVTVAEDFAAMTTLPQVDKDGKQKFNLRVPDPAFWARMREALFDNLAVCAKMTGIPALATLDLSAQPRESLKIADVIAAYTTQSPATAKSKKEATTALEALATHAQAVTLADLTIEKLTAFRQSVAGYSAGTQQAYFGRIKSILGFALKIGMDQPQIRAALDRCRVLWTSTPVAPMQPHPMSREHFHALLKIADPIWRARLLLAMNCCFYIADLRDLKWTDIDLDKATFSAIRGKTRIPRVATLWAETVEAIKKLPRRGQSPYVFTSTHGTKYNRTTMGNDFMDLRTKAGVPDTVKFADIRDGSFTAATQAATDPRWAQVLAGHASGMQDHYVLRDAAKVKPACDAVYKAYGPFPATMA
jgi:integrase